MLKYLYFSIFALTLFLRIVSQDVICKEHYDTYPYPLIQCNNSTGGQFFLCPASDCTTTTGASIAKFLYFTKCYDKLNQTRVFPYLWPDYMYHKEVGKIEVGGKWSQSYNGTRLKIHSISVVCPLDGKKGLNTARAACHQCKQPPPPPPPRDEPCCDGN
ncbi:hypothetical protein O181_000120 [Austropuccinia psidii MF-1]|uniref:Secreted protein n=1 Tax=Austropuccinia psidii MF-1 TaxID=1389203 RepID=A0A9Q3GAJ4_9BASI|nr:hypothetical protein [Austropuccinia psidii MF-1]